MEQSKANDLVLSDVLNVLKHLGFGEVAAVVLSAISGYLVSGTPIDWKVLATGSAVTLIHGLQVLVDRYLRDNSK